MNKQWFGFVLCICLSLPLSAQEEAASTTGPTPSFFSHAARKNEHLTRQYFWFPVISYVAPGFGQYVYGQYGAGATYTAMGAVGLGVGLHALAELGSSPTIADLDSDDWRIRQAIWGLKTYDLAGSLSAYHAFRTSVKEFHSDRFAFLGEGETTDELLIAPARLDFFTRWTTLIPLGILAGGLVALMANDNYNTGSVYGRDLSFSAALSYNAGVGEEALFRGFLFPVMTDLVDSPFWGNMATSAIFALAHISDENPVPWPQFLAGYYFGWLVKRNNWTLSEAVFVHTWWNIIVFSFNFAQGDKKAAIYVPLYQTQF